jgi:rhodanese-related sulfurtransferase
LGALTAVRLLVPPRGAKDYLPGAVHLGTGIIEHCGGPVRSALAADNLQKMGYTNVISMDGGIRDWRAKGYPLTKS